MINGFWGGQSERCFVDVRVFNPYAASNKCSSLSATYKKHENIKHRAYGQWKREVAHASFTPLVMSATGGLAHEATIFYKHLATLYLPSGEIVMPSHWAGFAAAFLFRCCILPSLASAVLCRHPVTMTELHPNGSCKGGASFNGLINNRLYLFVCFLIVTITDNDNFLLVCLVGNLIV